MCSSQMDRGLQVKMEEDMTAQVVEWQRRDFEAGYAPGGMPVVIHKPGKRCSARSALSSCRWCVVPRCPVVHAT